MPGSFARSRSNDEEPAVSYPIRRIRNRGPLIWNYIPLTSDNGASKLEEPRPVTELPRKLQLLSRDNERASYVSIASESSRTISLFSVTRRYAR